MKQDDLEIERQVLQIHYYLNDKSHSMNASIRNALERDMLKFVAELSSILGVNIKIESQARKEGGLIECLILGIPVIALYFKQTINSILTYYFTGGKYKNKELKLNNDLKEEELKRSKIQTRKEQIELENMQRLKDSHILKRMASNFYKKAENYKKIEKIGYEVDGIDEVIVLRSEFKSFIIRDNKDIKLIEEAKIEVISPVLKEGNYKWKGLYDKEKIDFSMGDFSFKTDIINQKYNFYNGTSIVCQL